MPCHGDLAFCSEAINWKIDFIFRYVMRKLQIWRFSQVGFLLESSSKLITTSLAKNVLLCFIKRGWHFKIVLVEKTVRYDVTFSFRTNVKDTKSSWEGFKNNSVELNQFAWRFWVFCWYEYKSNSFAYFHEKQQHQNIGNSLSLKSRTAFLKIYAQSRSVSGNAIKWIMLWNTKYTL